jgi:hypothetical protein
MATKELFSTYGIPATFPVSIIGSTDEAGQLVGTYDVELAFLTTLQGYLPNWLTKVELDRSIQPGTLPRPPGPESYYGSVDDLAFQQDELPALICHVAPTDAPEHSASFGYGQVYEVTLYAVVVQGSEDEARQLSSYYGTAAMGAILQNASLGGHSLSTRLRSAPTESYPNPDNRTLAVSEIGFTVFVEPIVNDTIGPFLSQPTEPPWGSWPPVQSENITVIAEPLILQFQANTTQDSPTLSYVNPFPGSVPAGTVLSGEGIPTGSTITGFSIPGRTLTMSLAATETGLGTAVTLTVGET